MEIHNRIVYGDVYWIDLDGLDQNRGGDISYEAKDHV